MNLRAAASAIWGVLVFALAAATVLLALCAAAGLVLGDRHAAAGCGWRAVLCAVAAGVAEKGRPA